MKSSVTPSARWELDQLDTAPHRHRVTVVFDAQAIAAKGAILDYQQAMLDQGGRFIWPKNPSPLPPGQRETSLDCNFHPAVAAAPFAILRDYAAFLRDRIQNAIARQDLTCGLLFLNDLQLRIYTTLQLGEHGETGLALAAYSGTLQAVLTAYRRIPVSGRGERRLIAPAHPGGSRLGHFPAELRPDRSIPELLRPGPDGAP